ncbi:MBL fold metallo-hydrolase [Pontibaca salina]|uniref:MBL fold metallo-hydrolase n=1 Tax=Pontibaca salina TaxID=2795731 RepID=A0A934HPP8_9RHOB|nr:MBL fold metallo-hydrolase [Pontibaca salina]MBI6628265.1 MBL fold metallo-hydrolase [Pontibaca salina]
MTVIRTSPAQGDVSAEVTGFYEPDTGSIQYVVSDPETKKAALIDVVMGFDHRSAKIDSAAAQEILDHVKTEGLEVEWILDTHPHADHLMASSWLKERLGAPNAIGSKVAEIAELWREIYHMPDAFDVERDFDRLFADGDRFRIGGLDVRVMLSPGHTLGSITYVVADVAFVHDTFMQPDVGTSRADFPGGDAGMLYDSLQQILELPDETRLFIGHDYGTEQRDQPEWESTVKAQGEHNKHIGGGVGRAAYVARRTARDKTLALPNRMLHVLQMNLRAGRSPVPEADGHSYLKIPLNRF